MNLLTKTMIAAGTASIALSPIAAAAAPAAPIAVRAAPSVLGDSDLRGKRKDNDAPGFIVALIVLAALAVAFVLITDDDNDNRPISP